MLIIYILIFLNTGFRGRFFTFRRYNKMIARNDYLCNTKTWKKSCRFCLNLLVFVFCKICSFRLFVECLKLLILHKMGPLNSVCRNVFLQTRLCAYFKGGNTVVDMHWCFQKWFSAQSILSFNTHYLFRKIKVYLHYPILKGH